MKSFANCFPRTSRPLRRAWLAGIGWLYLLLLPSGFALEPNKEIHQYNCRAWTYQNGLPVTSVRAVAQTKDGYLWLGTHNGLVRFDGMDFTLVSVPPIPELRNTSVQVLCPSSSGGLWFGLQRSAYGFRAPDGGWRVGKDERVGWDWDVPCLMESTQNTLWVGGEHAGFGSPDTLKLQPLFPNDTNPPFVVSLLGDSKGRVWVGTVNRGLYCWQNGRLTKFPDQSLDSCIISSMAEDKQGHLWIASNVGLFCYDNNLRPCNLPPWSAEFPAKLISCLMVDHHGVLWIGTSTSGLFRWKDGVLSSLQRADGLTSDIVLALTEDHEGSLWIGTSEGLNQLTDVKFQTYGKESGLPTEPVFSVSMAPQGGLWAATYLGAVFWQSNQMTLYSITNAGAPDSYVKRLLQSRNGDVFWITGRNIIYVVHDGKVVAQYNTPGMPVAMIEDAVGVIVSVVGDLYRVSRLGIEPYSFAGGRKPDLYFILNLSPGRDGSIWVASVNGVCQIKDGKFKQWTAQDGLADSNARWVWEDTDGTVWIGMATGIARLRNNQIRNFHKEDGLLNGNIWSIMPDDLGNLWVDTRVGLCRLNKQNVEDFCNHKVPRIECIAYDGPESVKPADKYSQECSACLSPDGRIWLPNAKGILMVDSRNIPVNNSPPPVHLQHIHINGQELPPTNHITVAPGRGEVEFSYAALSYIAPHKVRFRYQLEGFDPDWVDAGSRRLAFYTNLKPGHYRFRVIAANSDGVWNNKGDALEIELLPHFYQTGGFYVLGVGLVLALLGGIYAWRVRHLERARRALQAARDLLETEVAKRTTELARANTSLQYEIGEHKRTGIELAQRTRLLENEITERERIQKEVERVHRQLVDASRRAGMAEVATSVLHNVGNVLNSINVSTTLVFNAIKNSRANHLGRLAAMVNEHRNNLAGFFTTDAKGRQLPNYLTELAQHLTVEQTNLLKEVETTRHHVEHIRDIVTMQQNYAKISGLVEKVKVVDLVEDALRMNAGALVRHDVQVRRDYAAEVPEITVERHKVLQILVNVIRNAKYACDESGRADKRLTIQINNGNGRVQIAVIDNGVGIPAENMTRIFNHGFTTRPSGHGFGLHSSALAAGELGGELTAHSDGPGTGARFVLHLPLQPPTTHE